MGSLGEINLEQGLEVMIGGEIRPGTELSAHLTDQGSSLEGSTREISDFDMVYVTLTNPSFSISAGDQIAQWPVKGILSGQKKIKGISASVTPRGTSVSAFGSFSGGSYTVETQKGRDGVQGPYYLSGKGEAGFISPINGTVRVRVNGTEMEEGLDKDFRVDYDLGTITFNPKILIRQDDFIRIEYEYKTFDYQRSFTGAAASYSTSDSVFSVKGVLWNESDNKDQPIELTVTSQDREMLRSAGDSKGYLTPTSRSVHHNDVASMSALYPLYRKTLSTSGDTIFVYTPYNPLSPDSTREFYTVWFTRSEQGTAGSDYDIDSSIYHRDYVYRYTGPGQGHYSALAPLPAPRRETAGEIEARLKLPSFKASINVAGKDLDQNLFSPLDDDDNRSSAAVLKLQAGQRRPDKLSLWWDLDYRFRSRLFTNEIISDFERKSGWDIQDSSRAQEAHQFQSWESAAGATIMKGLTTQISLGQTLKDSLAETEKVSGDINLSLLKDKLALSMGMSAFRHHLSDLRFSYRRFGKITARPVSQLEASVGYNDEWRQDTSGMGGGQLSGNADLLFRPLNLRQSLIASQFRKGNSFPGSVDTGYALTWNQGISVEPLSGWTLSGDSKYYKTQTFGSSSSSTFLMSLLSEILPQNSGFSSRQEYRTNQELASRFEQKIIYVGKNLGTHAYDSLTREFVPSLNGDHIVEEIEIYDNTSTTKVRKTSFEGDWNFRPIKKVKGILGDLSWNGTLLLDEHVNAQNRRFATRIPGLLSLFPSTFSDSGSVTDLLYADLSYRQEIEWQIPKSPYRARIYALPQLKVLRGRRESAFETGLKAERKTDKLLLSAEPRYITINREDSTSYADNEHIKDLGLELVQSFQPTSELEFYLREKGGRIFGIQNGSTPAPSDSSIYFQLKPGIVWRPALKGMAELSYTFSYVPVSGQLDYRIAGGHSSGVNHNLSLFADIQAGKHFNLSGVYRAEITKELGATEFGDVIHVFSLQVKAYL